MIGHTVFALGFSRVFELIFWLGSFRCMKIMKTKMMIMSDCCPA